MLSLNLFRNLPHLVKILCCVGLYCSAFLFSAEADQIARRIKAHLIIKDPQSAYEEAKAALFYYPYSTSLHENFIKSLACLGNEREMLKAWETYVEYFPDRREKRELIEEMCWGILNKASSSPSNLTRLMALLAAYFSQDARGVDILYQGMSDSSFAIRAAAVQLAGHLRDTKLKDEVKRLFKEEQVWAVRQEVIKAIGQMKIHELRSHLEALIASEQSLAEEKALAIEALIELLDQIEREEIVRLAFSNRSGLRLLACEAIAHFQSARDQDLLFRLADDRHPHVRITALQTLGLLHPKDDQNIIINIARHGIHDSNSKVAISAAWLLTLYAPLEGQKAFEKYLDSDQRDVRVIAASALGSTGRYGAPLALRLFETHEDPYVRLNLTLGLIGQRLVIPQTTCVLDRVMNTEKERWVWIQQGMFQVVAPRSIKKCEAASTSSTPEMENQLVRLEILNILAILQAPTVQESIRRFLEERTWGVSGVAAALLLMEGDDSAIQLVQGMLQDSNAKIRLQAALVLSLWGREESAIQVLQAGYWNADKDLKIKIIEGLGRIGSMSSVPFLIQILREPSQTLRIVAAMAIIQCLHH